MSAFSTTLKVITKEQVELWVTYMNKEQDIPANVAARQFHGFKELVIAFQDQNAILMADVEYTVPQVRNIISQCMARAAKQRQAAMARGEVSSFKPRVEVAMPVVPEEVPPPAPEQLPAVVKAPRRRKGVVKIVAECPELNEILK